MALINCPECNKEISDKVKACPHCGYPFISDEDKNVTINKKNHKILFIIPLLVLMLVVIGGSFYYIKVIKPSNNYKEAVKLLESGKYEEANSIFEKVSSYKDVKKLQQELKFESMVYQCITSLKQCLKNPDSLQIYDVKFYQGISVDTSDVRVRETFEPFEKYTKDNPLCVMKYGAQNGFGGNTTSFGVFTYNSDTKTYDYFGSCDSLNEKEIDDKDEKIVCQFINVYINSYYEISKVDLSRIKNILKNDAYSTIKIIE